MGRSKKGPTMKTNAKILPTILFSLLLGACGGVPATGGATNSGGAGSAASHQSGGPAGPADPSDPNGSSSPPAPQASKTVEETLDRLGVDRNLGQRAGVDGKPLPTSYSPLGNQTIFKKVD